MERHGASATSIKAPAVTRKEKWFHVNTSFSVTCGHVLMERLQSDAAGCWMLWFDQWKPTHIIHLMTDWSLRQLRFSHFLFIIIYTGGFFIAFSISQVIYRSFICSFHSIFLNLTHCEENVTRKELKHRFALKCEPAGNFFCLHLACFWLQFTLKCHCNYSIFLLCDIMNIAKYLKTY